MFSIFKGFFWRLLLSSNWGSVPGFAFHFLCQPPTTPPLVFLVSSVSVTQKLTLKIYSTKRKCTRRTVEAQRTKEAGAKAWKKRSYNCSGVGIRNHSSCHAAGRAWLWAAARVVPLPSSSTCHVQA